MPRGGRRGQTRSFYVCSWTCSGDVRWAGSQAHLRDARFALPDSSLRLGNLDLSGVQVVRSHVVLEHAWTHHVDWPLPTEPPVHMRVLHPAPKQPPQQETVSTQHPSGLVPPAAKRCCRHAGCTRRRAGCGALGARLRHTQDGHRAKQSSPCESPAALEPQTRR